MALEKSHSICQPATLKLVGHEPSTCAITHITSTQATVSVDNGQVIQTNNHGDLVELQVSISGSKLNIKTSFDSKRGNIVRLNYLNPRDPAVRQLVNWFSQPAAIVPALASEASILEEIQNLTLLNIGGLLDIFLEQTDSRLLSLAEVATNNDQQNRLFEVKSELRQHRVEIHQRYCNKIRRKFDNPTTAATPHKDTTPKSLHENMELIDLEAFEDWLSLEVIIRRSTQHYFTALSCLEKRFAKLLKTPITTEQLPVGVHVLCLSIQETLKHYSIAHELLPIIYRFYDEIVIQHLDELYDALNARLKAYGVLPNIESQILRDSRNLITGRDNHPPARPASTGENPVAGGCDHIPANVVPINNSPVLFNTVRDLMGMLRNPAPDVEQVPSGAALDPAQLLADLSELQHNQQAVDAIAGGSSLTDWLQQSAKLQLTDELMDLLQLIGAVFNTLNDYPQIPDAISQQVKRLQIPIARTALVDSSFFADPEHPAKQLLNKMIELSLNSEMPNRALETKFDAVVRDINNNVETDSQVFVQALSQLTVVAKHQDKAFTRNTERITQTYEGRQRLHKAEEAVDREIQRRVSPPLAPEIVVELLDNGWRELLKLTYIKMGSDSDSWRVHLDTLDQLLVWIGENDSDNMQDLDLGLEADSFADLIGQQLHDVFPGDYRYQGTVEKIRDTLKGRRQVEMIRVSENQMLVMHSPNDLQKELETANPQLSRWLKRARNLAVGEEFSYLGDDSGQRNIKLAWISEDKQHFVFVNSRGQKVLDYDLVDLANELSKGLSPVTENSEWPLVERSLYSTVQQAYEKLAFKSSHDELTGLINRKECERLLNGSLIDAKNNRQHHCLLYADIDNFSLTNNLHGHVAGDQLLIDLSHLLEDNTPENSIIGRMAGNEFIIILQRRDLPESIRLAEQLLRAIEHHSFQWQSHPVQFTASMGLVVINKYTENTVDLMRNAISACQAAKKNGGNRVMDYRQDAQVHNRRAKLLSWIDKLNNVLTSDRLCLRAQSIVSTESATRNASHYEILLAIRNDAGELESPIEFIEAAECYNRMQRVDRWVIENTFIWLNSLAAAGKPLPAVSINLSGNSLNDDHFLDFILDQFARYKVSTRLVCFEVTETATINNLAEAADFIRDIKRIGCKFSLDDFGSGNASYQYLRHLPVDYLKIDGMFVREIDKNKNDYALVKSINEIAHLMGKQTIAEYAESEAIIELLGEIGVDYIQGFAISKPTALTELIIK